MLLIMWALTLLTSPRTAEAPTPPSDEWRTGYSIGFQIGVDFRRQKLDIQPDLLIQGLSDALEGSGALMSREEMSRALALLQVRAEAESERRHQEGDRYITGYAGRDGASTLPSGLAYRILQEGSGTIPSVDSLVTIHYRGRLIDGTEFDSSIARSEPATLRVRDAIQGWKEALLLMKEGSIWEIVLPPGMGYPDRPPPLVLPGSTLIFEIELISVNDGP